MLYIYNHKLRRPIFDKNMSETKPTKFSQLIGNTPLVDLGNFVNKNSAKLYAKCEFLNPGCSMKDRIAEYILDRMQMAGKIKKGDTIVCASSGNTGCSFALLGSIKGYSIIVVTSKKCSIEKQNHIRALKAKLIVVDDRSNYMEYARRLAEENGYFAVDQYNNPYNPETYYKTLGPEIWKQTNGKITYFVMTGSTFGCITGTAKFLKEKNPKIKVILADPLHSNIYDYYYNGYKKNNDNYYVNENKSYIIEGAGKYKPTKCLDFSIIDRVVKISDRDAILCCHELLQKEGLLVGGSSGLNVFAAKITAERLTPNDVVVTILCDSGIKYLSKIYDREFLNQNNINL